MLQSHSLRLGLFAGLIGLPLFALGCPDPEARFDEFVDATKDQRMDAGEESTDTGESDSGESDSTDTGEPETLPDMSGIYLLALETALGPDLPLQFIVTFNMEVAPDGQSGTGDFQFQPLSLIQGSQLEPRECLDEMLTFNDIPIDAEGNFEIDMGVVEVTGMANPVTGSDISASLVVAGRILYEGAYCGEITGMLMSPLEYDLAGSTFAAIRLADDGCNPATLPTEFPYKCNQVPPEPAGDGDGDTTDTGTDTTTG